MRNGEGTTFDAAVTGERGWAIRDSSTEARAIPIGIIALHDDGTVAWTSERSRETMALLADAIDDLARLATTLAEGTTELFRLRLSAPDGDVTVIEAAGARVPKRVGGTVLMLYDVTARDRLERADAEFVQNAAHQLRTPITAITASVAALTAGAADDAKQRARFLEHVARESQRMARVVDSLLILSGLQRGDRAEPQRHVIPLRELLDAAAAAHPAVERFTIDCDEQLAVVGDRELLVEAIGNVVANACQHAASEVRLTTFRLGDSIAIDVTDDGAGVPVDARDRVFERFFRADPSFPGSGLGLPIARAAVEASGGTLELLDAGGPGATFRLRLPGARRR